MTAARSKNSVADNGIFGCAEARFYDANNRTWLAIDPIKDGGNWYQYCYSNPTTYYDPTGLAGFSPFSGCVDVNKLAEQLHSGFRDLKGKISGFVDNIDWSRVGAGALKAAGAGDWHNGGGYNWGSSTSGIGGVVCRNVSAGTTIVTLGTAAAGTAAFAFGSADMMEALQDLCYGLKGSSNVSFNPLRDSMFTGNEDLYYELEMLATLTASAGTITFRSFNMESEINASEIVRYEKNSTFETSYGKSSGNYSGADNIADAARLKEYYKQAEKYGTGSIKELQNGRFRFYEELKPARTQGEMAGARHVREWVPDK